MNNRLNLDISDNGPHSPAKSTGSSVKSRPMIELGDSMEKSSSFDDMEATYRQEGVSVSQNRMRIEGEEIYMQVFESDLIIERRIGQGACSSVHRARHKNTGELYALKMFNVYDRERRKQLQKEIRILSIVQCDSLIAFYGAFHKEGNIGVILEYMDRGSLEFIKQPDIEITEEALAGISYQIMWGLAYLHFEHNLHRDIKPGNVLINTKGEVKLSDFGISRSLDNTQAMSSTSVGTFKYMSLERLLGGDYNASSDIWSVGVMLIELWNKKYPFDDCCASPIELVQVFEETVDMKHCLGSAGEVSKDMRRFLLDTLKLDPNVRLTASKLLESSWFVKLGIHSLEHAQDFTQAWVSHIEPTYQDNEIDDDDEEDLGMSMSMSMSMSFGRGRNSNNNNAYYSDDDDDYNSGKRNYNDNAPQSKSSSRGYK